MSYVEIRMDFEAGESDQAKIIKSLDELFQNGLYESHQEGRKVKLYAAIRSNSLWLNHLDAEQKIEFQINGVCIPAQVFITVD
jgi:hypothetical protein